MVLAQAKEDMKRNPRLTLPEDPNINIWNYYSIMKVTPIIMENFLLVILTIPLADQSLVMNLYKVHNMPALHPELHVQFEYQLEGEYLAITKDKQYAALPTARDIRICETTERYLCPMNQALYPVDKIEWCVYALYKQDTEKIGTYCTIVIGTVYPNIPLSSASLHGHPQSSLGATLGVRMSATAYGNLSTMSCVWPIGTSRLNLRPRPLSI